MPVKPYAENFGPFWVGEQPADPVTVDFLDESGSVTDRPEAALTATLVGPYGLPIPAAQLAVASESDTEYVQLEWVTPPIFDRAGIWAVRLQPSGEPRLAPLRFVVQDDETGWATLDDAREGWSDAPESDALLYGLLEAARVACVNWAPVLAEGTPVPVGYQLAQIMQARAVWNSVKAGGESMFGADGFTVRVFPLDMNVKQLLRPKRAKPVIR